MCCNNNYFRRQPKIDSNWVNKSVSYMKANQSKLVKSALCFTSYAGVGGVITLLGACLLDYQILTDQSFQAISYMVQVRSIGYIVGSLSAASCEKYFQQSQILTVSNLILGGALIASPWFQNLIPLLVATLFVGLGLGILEIYLHVYIGHLWKSESTNYLQALHVFFDIGALIAPLITRPFLLPMDPDEYNQQTAQINLTNSSDVRIFTKDDILIQYPHLMLGLLLIIVGVVFGFIGCCNDEDKQESNQTRSQVLEWRHFTAIAVTALIVNFEFGAQNLVSALGPAFTVKSGLKMSKQDAALLISVYWITCCIYRLVLIPVAIFVKEQYLIVINVVIMIIAGLLMIQSGDRSTTMTWISFILMGMGFSPCFALVYGLVQKYFTIPSKMGSLVFLCGTIGESLHPWIVANYLESRPTFYTDYFASIAFCNSILCLFHVAFVTQIMSKSSFKLGEYQSL